MDVEMLDKTDNPLLGRTEIEFSISHPKGATPKRNEVRDAIASELGAKKETVVIDHLSSTFGKPVTRGYCKVYKSVEEARTVELKHIQKRNNILIEKKGAKEEAPKEEKPAKPAEEKAEEPKEEAAEEPPKEEAPAPEEKAEEDKPVEEEKGGDE